jgi:acetyl-CoA acyltransferase
MGEEVVIVEAVRTPLGKRNGVLKDVHPVVMAAHILRVLIHRAGIEPEIVDDVIFGCVTQHGEQGVNIARNAWLATGFPYTTPATTVDRQCGSSQQAIHFAAGQILAGACDVVIAGGVESMSRVPMGSNFSDCGNAFPPELLELYDLVPQGISAQLVANKYGISRREMDEYGVRSHRLAAYARDHGYFDREIVPMEVSSNGSKLLVTKDEGIRDDTSYEKVAALQPAFNPEHQITAGNSSQITDGAAAVLLMSLTKAKELGLKPRARIVAQTVVGTDPVLMLEGPIPATRKVLSKAGLRLEDIDLFEINEAFASVVLAWAKEIQPDMDKVNVNGGAIALGHPLGATGARLMTTLLHELERRGARYGLQAMCIGGGMGTATIIERLD